MPFPHQKSWRPCPDCQKEFYTTDQWVKCGPCHARDRYRRTRKPNVREKLVMLKAAVRLARSHLKRRKQGVSQKDRDAVISALDNVLSKL